MAQALSYDEMVDRLVEWSVAEPRVRALWLEGSSMEEVRRPYQKLQVHLTCDEPHYPQLLSELSSVLERLLGANAERELETRRFARQFEARCGNRPFTLIAEQSHLLAKRPRAEVVPLLDKTGHLVHVLDYSLRRR